MVVNANLYYNALMKIGVNSRLLSKPFTGIGQYTKNMFRELAEIDPSNQYILVVPEKVPEEIAGRFPKNVQIKVLPEKLVGTAGMRKTWWEQVQIPEFFVKEKVDLAFFTYPCNPWSKKSLVKGIKTVVVVHDCIPWMHKSYRLGLLSRLYHAQTRKAVARADLVLTVSGASMSDIVRVCHVDEKKIEVLYNDADEIYKQPLEKPFVNEVLQRFSLKSGGFFLYVGGYDERKNVKFLVSEYHEFSQKHAVIPLVLAGGKLFSSKLYDSFDEGLGNVVRTGFLSEEELAALYKSCLAFINLSSHEGFNIPILEAANSGVAMILSDIAVHREVAEDAAIFVNTDRPGAAEKAMESMLGKNAKEDFQKKSSWLARKYSWAKYAKILKNMLSSLVNKK